MTEYQLPLPAPWTLETLPDYIDQLSNFIKKYLDIGEFVSVDRFLREYPVDWGKDFTLETWMEIILGEYKGELPDDFAELMKLSRTLPLVDFPTPIVDIVTEQSIVGKGDVSAETKTNLLTQKSKGTKRPRDGCTPQKNHELDALIIFLEQMTELHEITTKKVIDVGAGVGHLSWELAKEGYTVVAIEGNERNARKCADITAARPEIQCVTKYINDETDLNVIQDPCISVSIHACGELSVNQVRHFVSYDNVELILNVPCCYNRLAPESFPLSVLFHEKNVQLSLALRQEASQFVEKWTIDNTSLVIRKQFYRAVLGVLLHRHGIDNLRTGKQKDRVYQDGFKGYLTAIVEQHGLPAGLVEEAGIIDEYKVESMYPAVCLRAMCAAVAESLLILDRWMFVKENLPDGHVVLHKLFDSEISPRRWAIVAVR